MLPELDVSGDGVSIRSVVAHNGEGEWRGKADQEWQRQPYRCHLFWLATAA
jgi:hypothetical protein